MTSGSIDQQQPNDGRLGSEPHGARFGLGSFVIFENQFFVLADISS
jgi:hypothetical protein